MSHLKASTTYEDIMHNTTDIKASSVNSQVLPYCRKIKREVDTIEKEKNDICILPDTKSTQA